MAGFIPYSLVRSAPEPAARHTTVRLVRMTTTVALAEPIASWFEQNARPLPWREPSASPWQVLVSEFMLQQTQVERVLPRYEEWIERWPTPEALAAAPAADAIRAWGRLGYPRRALWLHRAAEQIQSRFGGEVPSDVETLETLTGIGPYTARAVAVFAFGAHEPVVDTNTRRVIARAVHGLAAAANPSPRDLDDVRRVLGAPSRSPLVNAGLMELGQTVCTAASPRCDACPILEMCEWRGAGYPDNAPKRRPGQAKFRGSDREARGKVMALLRSSVGSVTRERALAAAEVSPERAPRIIDSLVSDGLIVEIGDSNLSLPTGQDP